MRTHIYVILFWAFSLAPVNTKCNEQDSLLRFLEYVGEDSMVIAKILDCPEGREPLKVIKGYLLGKHRLIYNPHQCDVAWVCCPDSILACRCVEYMTQKVVSDTALYLMHEYLLPSYLAAGHDTIVHMLLNCAEYAVVAFHSRQALSITGLHYYNHEEIVNRQEKMRFYSMMEYILLNVKYFNGFDIETKCQLKKITGLQDVESPYFLKFRRLLDSYSDIDLARITDEQEQEMVSILQRGIANGEKKAELTYSFMLQTGQFLEKNEDLGTKILFDLLKNY